MSTFEQCESQSRGLPQIDLMMYGLDINGTVTSGNKLADASRSQSVESTSSGTPKAPVATSGAGTVRSSWVGKLLMMIFACLLL